MFVSQSRSGVERQVSEVLEVVLSTEYMYRRVVMLQVAVQHDASYGGAAYDLCEYEHLLFLLF